MSQQPYKFGIIGMIVSPFSLGNRGLLMVVVVHSVWHLFFNLPFLLSINKDDIHSHGLMIVLCGEIETYVYCL